MPGFNDEFIRIERQLKSVKDMAANIPVGIVQVELGEMRQGIVERLSQQKAALLAVGQAFILRRLAWFEAFAATVDASFKAHGWSLFGVDEGALDDDSSEDERKNPEEGLRGAGQDAGMEG